MRSFLGFYQLRQKLPIQTTNVWSFDLTIPFSLTKNNEKNVQTSQKSIHGNLLDSLIFYNYEFFCAKKTQVAEK